MEKFRSGLWRPIFILSAVLLISGGSRHPREETIAGMLANPDWFMSHALVLAGFVLLLVGLIFYQRNRTLPDAAQKWMRLAIIATVLQVVEMFFHTVAASDSANLSAGRATPLLTTHLWLSVIIYPIFGLVMARFIIATASQRVLGSVWIAWLGVLGVLAQGVAPPLVLVFNLEGARILFPLLILFALWMILAALWPLRAGATESEVDINSLADAQQGVPAV